MRRILFLILFTLTGTIVLHAQESTDTDGIPANCESVSSYANPLLFPRYANGTLALINWSSGETALILEQNNPAPNFWFVGWSPDCHYLVGGLGDGERYTTIIWDALTGTRIGTVEDGYRRPHFLTWSPRSDAVVVEMRNGTLLWNMTTGQQIPLTLDAGGWMARSFLQINWNYEAGTLETMTVYNGYLTFDLTTGRPVGIAIPEDEVLSVRSAWFGSTSTGSIIPPSPDTPFGCRVYRNVNGRQAANFPNGQLRFDQGRLILQDGATGEVIGVLEDDYELSVRRGWPIFSLSANCEYLFTLLYMEDNRSLREGVVIRVRDSVRVHSILRMPARRWYPDFERANSLPRYEWDPSLRYLFAQSYEGAQIWDSLTDSTFYVTTPEESARYGFSVDAIIWDIPNGRATLDMLYSRETRVIDLATGERTS